MTKLHVNSTAKTLLLAPLHQLGVTALVLLGLCGLSGKVLAQDQAYKWKSNDGTVRYSDTIPPEDVDKERALIDSNGIQIKKIGRAKTKKEIEAEQAKKTLEAERQRKLAEQRKHDRNLMRNYRTERDIVRARSAKLKSIDLSIEIKQDSIELSKSKIRKLQKTAARYERASRRIPPKINQRIQMNRDLIRSAEQSIARSRQRQEKIKQEYQALLVRYRKLKGVAD